MRGNYPQYCLIVFFCLFVKSMCMVSQISLARTTRTKISLQNDVISAKNTRSVECDLARNYSPGLGNFWYCTVDLNAVFLVNKNLLLTKVTQNLYGLENHII